ncbi:hypothetical protein ACFPRL_33285 [Pseudoclavibacter helvolus]
MTRTPPRLSQKRTDPACPKGGTWPATHLLRGPQPSTVRRARPRAGTPYRPP